MRSQCAHLADSIINQNNIPPKRAAFTLKAQTGSGVLYIRAWRRCGIKAPLFSDDRSSSALRAFTHRKSARIFSRTRQQRLCFRGDVSVSSTWISQAPARSALLGWIWFLRTLTWLIVSAFSSFVWTPGRVCGEQEGGGGGWQKAFKRRG